MTTTTTASPGHSRGLAGLGSLAAFELPVIDADALESRRSVRSWDYRSREHLVVMLAGTEPEQAAIAEAARRERELRAEDAALLVVFQTAADGAAAAWERAGGPGTALEDATGRVHEKLGGGPALLVVDRDGTIYWRAALSEAPAGRLFDEALGWLGYMNILEHECGTCVPAWPDEDFA